MYRPYSTVAPGVAYPPAAGEQVATMEVAIPGLVLGHVPLFVSDVPAPPPLDDDGPWWARAAGSVVDAVGGVLRSTIG